MKAATVLYVGQCQCAFVYVCMCVCVSCICVFDKGRHREEAKEEVSDSHVLELGHVSQACCVSISCPLCPS